MPPPDPGHGTPPGGAGVVLACSLHCCYADGMINVTCSRCGASRPLPDPLPQVVDNVCDACKSGVQVTPAEVKPLRKASKKKPAKAG